MEIEFHWVLKNFELKHVSSSGLKFTEFEKMSSSSSLFEFDFKDYVWLARICSDFIINLPVRDVSVLLTFLSTFCEYLLWSRLWRYFPHSPNWAIALSNRCKTSPISKSWFWIIWCHTEHWEYNHVVTQMRYWWIAYACVPSCYFPHLEVGGGY